VGLENALTSGEPGAIKFVIFGCAAGAVPSAFVDGDHASSVAGAAAVGEEVGRVGEDEVDGFGGECGEDLEAVAMEDFDVVARVVEGGIGEERGVLRDGRGGIHCCSDLSAEWVEKAESKATARFARFRMTN